MFLQEKEYIQLFRGGEKLMTAGLCKIIIWDQKIKVDYYMDHLPISNETNGVCHLSYLVRNEGEEQNLLERQLDFPLIFLKSKYHYAFQTRENAENKIVKVKNCYIELEGQHTLQMHGKRPELGADARSAADSGVSSDIKTDMQPAADSGVSSDIRTDVQPVADSGGLSEIKTDAQPATDSGGLSDVKTDVQSAAYLETVSDALSIGKSGAESDMRGQSNVQTGKNIEDTLEAYPVRRLDDLKELLKMGDNFVEYYYNSFLLHGFYQYRHLLLGKNFLGVPGYFYEREAIAAKMMGFPYFIEAEYADVCCMGKGNRTERPVEGSYGYFICSTDTQHYTSYA